MPVSDILTFLAALFPIIRTYREIGGEDRRSTVPLQMQTQK